MQGSFAWRCLPLRCPPADGFALQSDDMFVFSSLIPVLAVGFVTRDDGTFLLLN